MHNNYYFLRQLSAALRVKLEGFTLVSCFSQSKDELVIELNNTKESFFVKAQLATPISCLSFPSHYNRARKNSIDLFPPLILKKVIGIRQFENERSFAILLQDEKSIIFKMHGQQSNVLLVEGGKVTGIFRNHLEVDFEIDPDTLDRTIDWSKSAFLASQKLKAHYFTFGTLVWEYLASLGFDQLPKEDQWNRIQEVKALLENPDYFIIEKAGAVVFSLLPSQKFIQRHNDPLKAINEFFILSITQDSCSQEKSLALRQLRKSLDSTQSYIEKNKAKLNELVNNTHYKTWADLIMAHLHSIQQGASTVTLENFYDDNKPITIKLKPDISPQKNAEVFYRKSKNQQIEVEKLRESIAKKEELILKLNGQIQKMEIVTDLKELQNILKGEGLQKNVDRKPEEKFPFHRVEFKGFQIWIGKNSTSNDELTLKYSHKDDLWLHAKDVAGSHVLVKHQSGKPFPKDVIERAAQLAAYNSKRKNESLCPVAYTQKKYVRKRKGDPPGAVVVEREEVIMVEPKLD